MGVDAKAILKSTDDPLDIVFWLGSLDHVKDVELMPTFEEGFVRINFLWHGEQRHMACFYNGKCKCDYNTVHPHNACYVSIGKWGFSDAIIMSSVGKFGGFYQLNDCQDEWRGVGSE